MLPKTIIKQMANCATTTAEYDADKKLITLYLTTIKNHYKQWRRAAICSWIHEFTHHCQNMDVTDLVGTYENELQAYKIQWWLELFLFIPHDWDNTEEGALSSLKHITRWMMDGGAE